ASHRRLRYKDYVDQGSSEATSIDDTTATSIDDLIGVSIDNNNATSIDDPNGVSIDNNNPTSIDTLQMSQHAETETPKSEGRSRKKRTNWKKRKRTKGGSKLSLIPHFLDCVKNPE